MRELTGVLPFVAVLGCVLFPFLVTTGAEHIICVCVCFPLFSEEIQLCDRRTCISSRIEESARTLLVLDVDG